MTRAVFIQHISLTKDVHLFVEWSFAAPVRKFIVHTKRKPSFTSPSDAKNWELGLNASPRTPDVCSDNIDSGELGGASLAVEKIKTRGL